MECDSEWNLLCLDPYEFSEDGITVAYLCSVAGVFSAPNYVNTLKENRPASKARIQSSANVLTEKQLSKPALARGKRIKGAPA